MWYNLSKVGPPLNPPLFKWSCCNGCFSLESKPTYLCCSTRSYVKQEALKKQQWASGGTNKNEGRHGLLWLHKSAWKKSIAESLHVYIFRAIIVWVWVGHFFFFFFFFFERNITTLENTPTPIFEKPHSLSMDVFLRYYSSRVTHDCISFSGLVTAVTDHWNLRHWYIFWTSVLCVEWCRSPPKPSPIQSHPVPHPC